MRQTLLSQGLQPGLVETIIAQAIEAKQIAPDATSMVPSTILEQAEQQAHQIAVAMASGRKTQSQLIATAPAGLKPIYEHQYPAASEGAGIDAVEYLDRFPVLTGQFGYTRGPSNDPSKSTLVPFRSRSGDFVVYGEVAETEALFVRLDAVKALEWLRQNDINVELTQSRDEAHLRVLEAIGNDASGHVSELVTTLIHSIAHRFVRVAAVHTGVEGTSLAEFLVPLHLGFFIYAAARGDFVMGGLQAVFEGELHSLFQDLVGGESRCALDPGCASSGGACMACLHLGEPSCRLFNRMLSRAVLFGPAGYLHA
jgi:cellobiose-specific phosphotransferase system component IIA